MAIEKRNTAALFPNAIQISTLHHKYFFASFVYRDQAFILLNQTWIKSINKLFDDSDENILNLTLENKFKTENHETAVEMLDVPEVEVQSTLVEGNIGKISVQIPSNINNLSENLKSTFQILAVYHDFVNGGLEVPPWSGNRRHFSFNLKLPDATSDQGGGSHIRAYIADVVLTEDLNRIVIESKWRLEGITADSVNYLVRFKAFTINDERSKLEVEWQIHPITKCFFKESLINLIHTLISTFYSRVIQHLNSSIYDQNVDVKGPLEFLGACSVKRENEKPLLTEMTLYLIPFALLLCIFLYRISEIPSQDKVRIELAKTIFSDLKGIAEQ